MKTVHESHVALFLASVLALFHGFWSLLVFLGLGKPLLDWMFWIHFLANPFKVRAFDIQTAIILIVMTFVIGYAGGWVAGWVWNRVAKRK
ncbi:MAG TPA: hypothetical protein DIU47_04800 [Candidatus Pacebacteria bacterium]|nr:MAG: hypothetical protein UX00_C0004G0066 [Microgenomates group bacterium GW2011_GWB1_45_17]KKU23936.1 MAG: hypothetical protein UX35_C0003G0072 [Microgenomates group bacterium GW2011_GWA1_46_15]KKU24671.1 MAG: hypothetical protein UX36_C0001G0288 [Microgenomates group bacterium GW2011_GWC1_46_15]HCR93238.1 hypothetical protein [Candidatus Paceibacterota bacterium]